MKRFFCTVCKRVKRVRKWPYTIDTPSAESPLDRKGECNLHVKTNKRIPTNSVITTVYPNRKVKVS